MIRFEARAVGSERTMIQRQVRRACEREMTCPAPVAGGLASSWGLPPLCLRFFLDLRFHACLLFAR